MTNSNLPRVLGGFKYTGDDITAATFIVLDSEGNLQTVEGYDAIDSHMHYVNHELVYGISQEAYLEVDLDDVDCPEQGEDEGDDDYQTRMQALEEAIVQTYLPN